MLRKYDGIKRKHLGIKSTDFCRGTFNLMMYSLNNSIVFHDAIPLNKHLKIVLCENASLIAAPYFSLSVLHCQSSWCYPYKYPPLKSHNKGLLHNQNLL